MPADDVLEHESVGAGPLILVDAFPGERSLTLPGVCGLSVSDAELFFNGLALDPTGQLIAAELLKGDGKRSNRQIGEIVGLDHKTIGDVRQGLERRGEIPHVGNARDPKGFRQRASKLRQHPTSAEQLSAIIQMFRSDGETTSKELTVLQITSDLLL